MISGMHTNDGGEVVVCGHRVTMLPARHDLASYMDAAANDERATRPGWMSIASGAAAVLLVIGVTCALLAGNGVLQ